LYRFKCFYKKEDEKEASEKLAPYEKTEMPPISDERLERFLRDDREQNEHWIIRGFKRWFGGCCGENE